jgi:cell wall assembly regulator SMI1
VIVDRFRAKRIWRRCYRLLEERAPAILSRLPAGASSDLIREVEAFLGQPLPPVMSELYRIHNGLGLPALIRGQGQAVPLLSLEDALVAARQMCSALSDPTLHLPVIQGSSKVRSAYWLKSWLPIMTYGNGDNLFVDLAPNDGGQCGQIVEWRHEDDGYPVRHRNIEEYMGELDADWLADLSAELERP